YGVDPGVSIDAPVIWEFAWGRWVVNATKDAGQVNLANFEAYQRATPTGDATFKPLEANPLSGQWLFQPLSEGTLELPAFSQIILIDPVACPGCLPLSGDYTRDGQNNAADYNLWKADFGSQIQLSADGNRDGLVNAADYVFWRDRASSGIGAAVKVPEPSNGIFMLVLAGRFTVSMHMRI